MKLRGIHYGAYMHGETDVVSAMSATLGELCELIRVDLQFYGGKPSATVKRIERTPNGQVAYLHDEKVIADMKKHKPNFLIFNLGGLTLSEKVQDYAHKSSVVCVGILLSDPDVFPYNGKHYARMFDIFYTNSVWSISNQYGNAGNVKLLPFAASTKHHFYMPDVEKKFDVVIVGGKRPERNKAVRTLRKNFRVGWRNGHGRVRGESLARAINSGKMYLSFPLTNAGYKNAKVGVFEAAACNTLIVTEYFPEISHYFQPGVEIACYSNLRMLPDLVEYYLRNASGREWLRANCYARFLQDHTWETRWKNILHDIENFKH